MIRPDREEQIGGVFTTWTYSCSSLELISDALKHDSKRHAYGLGALLKEATIGSKEGAKACQDLRVGAVFLELN